VYFNVNFNVFFKLIKVYLLASELCMDRIFDTKFVKLKSHNFRLCEVN